jgi:hypothetical protein
MTFTTMAGKLAAQRQAGMFDEAPEDFELRAPGPALTMGAGGWIGHRDHHGLPGRNGTWTHPSLPGLEIHHCGHPTALRPYWIETGPGWGGRQDSGRKWPNLTDAQREAWDMARG